MFLPSSLFTDILLSHPSGELSPDPTHPAPLSSAPAKCLPALTATLQGQRGNPELMQPLQDFTRFRPASRAPVWGSHGHILHGQRPDASGEGQTDRGVDSDAEAEAEVGGDAQIPAGAGQDGGWNSGGERRK